MKKFKLNKILIKRGFRSLAKAKIFSILIMVLIFITGATYTMLSQSADSFRKSYNHVISQGKIHDHIIKSGFRFTDDQKNNSHLDFEAQTTSTGSIYDKKNWSVNNLKTISTEDLSDATNVKVYVGVQPTRVDGIYKDVPKTSTRIYLDDVHRHNDITSTNINALYTDLLEKIDQQKQFILSTLQQNLGDEVIKSILQWKLNGRTYDTYLNLRNNQSIFVQDGKKAFNVVAHNHKGQYNDVNEMVIYDGTKNFTTNLTDDQFTQQLQGNGVSKLSDYNIDRSKEFRVTARSKSSITTPITFTDPNAYQAIVSPAYANENNKKSISIESIMELFGNDPYIGDKLATDHYLQTKYKDNIIFVGNTPYFIIGIGTQPDYIYPIMNGSQPVVDPNHQAVVFTTKRGYLRTKDAFRSNPIEDYISIRFKDMVDQEDQDIIIESIRSAIKTGKHNLQDFPMSVYASSNTVDLVTEYNDDSDQLILAESRVTSLSKVNKAVQSLGFATTSLLIIFLLSIVIMIFKALISGSHKIYATLHALGYSKIQIALSNALASILLVAIPMFIAYGVGYGLQYFFIKQFAATWTIPTYGVSFSWVTLIVIIILPTIVLFMIIVFITLYEMRHTLPEMLNGSSEKSFAGIAKIASKFKIFSIKGKYVVALSLKNVGKLTLMTISSIIAMSALIIGMGTIGTSTYAYNQTISMNEYEFAVDLVSPTKEGGQYTIVNPYVGDNTRGKTTMPLINDLRTGNKVAWHVPVISDVKYTLPSDAAKANNLEASSKYLKNLIQHKAILDTGNLGNISAWDIAKGLMPDNQKNESNKNFNIIMHAIFDNELGEDNVEGKEIKDLVVKYNKLHSQLTEDEAKAQINKMIVQFFDQNLIKNARNKSFDVYNGEQVIKPYTISYNKILTNKGDETYTHINGFITDKDTSVSIKGINSLSEMVNINYERLLDLSLKQDTKGNYIIPILINQYLKTTWKVTKGDLLDININNFTTRFQGNQTMKAKLEIAGFVDGYNDSGIYTEQGVANKVLGLDEFDGFNGIFSKSKNPRLLTSLPLYSLSGLYVATDSFNNPAWNNWLQAYIQSNVKDKNWNSSITSASDFIDTYTSTPYAGLLANVRWNTVDKLTFKNVTQMTSTIIVIIEIISIIISILFTVIVASLLFKTNSKKISALWALGYRKREINRMFISMYIVPLIISIAISVPISIGVLTMLKFFIINFGHILIPFAITWWIPFVALAAIGLIFIASTSIIIYTKGIATKLDAFKED